MKILPRKEETVLFLVNARCAGTEAEVRSIILSRGVRLDNPKLYSNAQTL